jgi:hypothetical protein
VKVVKNIWGIWGILFFVCLPFSYSILPNIGIGISNGLTTILNPIAIRFGGNSNTALHSDSIFQYTQLVFLLVFAIAIGLSVRYIKQLSNSNLHTYLHIIGAYILAFFLLKYGIDKVFKFQFYDAEPNILHTNTGNLSKDMLFWTSMGSSYSYNLFMGLIEVIPGLLLLWNRTRFLGAIISLGVLINVVAINFGFDITVKINSSMLVALNLFILSFYSNRLKAIFLNKSSFQPNEKLVLVSGIKKRLLKGIAVTIILLECLTPFASTNSWNGDNRELPVLYGSYLVISGNSNDNITRIHIHSKGHFILEHSNGDMDDYKIKQGKNAQLIELFHSKTTWDVQSCGEQIIFTSSTGRIIKTTRIDLEQLPLNHDSFHWSIDHMH